MFEKVHYWTSQLDKDWYQGSCGARAQAKNVTRDVKRVTCNGCKHNLGQPVTQPPAR